MDAHPGTRDLLRFLEEQLPDPEHDAITQHINTCPLCQAAIDRLLKSAEDPTTMVVGESPIPLDVLNRIAANPPPQNVGDVVLPDEFELIEEIGRGGMGIVLKVRNKSMKNIVALKLLPQRYVDDPDRLRRFQNEMQALGQLTHPNIVQGLTGGVVQIPYLVMEYLEGENLSQLVARCGPLPLREACIYICQAAAGLAHAHKLPEPIIHRDVKPANLFLAATSSGKIIKVLDLGLAKFKLEQERIERPEETNVGVTVGTPGYIAPEQYNGDRNLDPRIDIYSLGCTFVYLLTGNPPVGPGLTSLERERLRGVTGEVLVILERMLAPHPENRYSTMAEVRRDLENWLALYSEQEPDKVEQPRALPRGQSHVWLAGGMVLLLVLIAVLAWFSGPQAKRMPPQPPLTWNLLPAVQLPQDIVTGTWQRDGNALVVSPADFSRLSLATVPEGDYDFQIQFVRDEGHDGEVNLILPVASQKSCAVFLGRAGQFGLETDAEKPLLERPHRSEFRNGEPHDVRCRVRYLGATVKIEVWCDGAELFAWEGAVKVLSPRQQWLIPRRSLGIGSHTSKVRFEKATLVMLNGEIARQLPGITSIGWHAADQGVQELFPLVDVHRDTLFGTWQRQQGAILAGNADFSRMQIPVVPLGSYEIKLEWERISGSPEMHLFLPAGESPFDLSWFMLSLPNGDWIGIRELDELNNKTATRPVAAEEFSTGKLCTALVRVEPNQDQVDIAVTVNGQPGIRWRGPRSILHVVEEWKIHPCSIALGVHGCSVRFRTLSIQRLSGKLLRILEIDREQRK